MEAKLDKLFSIFDEYKKNNLFKLCIRQIVEIHKECPSSVSYILKKTLKLIFSTTSDYRLQLEHRQIAAGIIEKTYKTHSEQMLQFLRSGKKKTEDSDCKNHYDISKNKNNQEKEELEEDENNDNINKNNNNNNEEDDANVLLQAQTLFHIQKKKIRKKPKDNQESQEEEDLLKEQLQSSQQKQQQNPFKSKEDKTQLNINKSNSCNYNSYNTNKPKKVKWLADSFEHQDIRWQEVDFEHLFQHEKPLLSRNLDEFQTSSSEADCRKTEEEILKKFGLVQNFNEANLSAILKTLDCSTTEFQMPASDTRSMKSEESANTNTTATINNSSSNAQKSSKNQSDDNNNSNANKQQQQTKNSGNNNDKKKKNLHKNRRSSCSPEDFENDEDYNNEEDEGESKSKQQKNSNNQNNPRSNKKKKEKANEKLSHNSNITHQTKDQEEQEENAKNDESSSKNRKIDQYQEQTENQNQSKRKKVKVEQQSSQQFEQEEQVENSEENRNPENEEQLQIEEEQYQTVVVNPYNIIFDKCMSNLLHSNWEIRHASALVLRAFLKENLDFLGFEHTLQTDLNNKNNLLLFPSSHNQQNDLYSQEQTQQDQDQDTEQNTARLDNQEQSEQQQKSQKNAQKKQQKQINQQQKHKKAEQKTTNEQELPPQSSNVTNTSQAPPSDQLQQQTSFFIEMLKEVRTALRRHVEDPQEHDRKVQNYLARNLILIALDRFADFVSEKSNIIVRETSCQMLTLLLTAEQKNSHNNNKQISDSLQFQQQLQQKKSKQQLENQQQQSSSSQKQLSSTVYPEECQDYAAFSSYSSQQSSLVVREELDQILQLLQLFLRQKEWEVQQSALFLINQILIARSDLRKSLLLRFRNDYLWLLRPCLVDDVIYNAAEGLLICLEENGDNDNEEEDFSEAGNSSKQMGQETKQDKDKSQQQQKQLKKQEKLEVEEDNFNKALDKEERHSKVIDWLLDDDDSNNKDTCGNFQSKGVFLRRLVAQIWETIEQLDDLAYSLKLLVNLLSSIYGKNDLFAMIHLQDTEKNSGLEKIITARGVVQAVICLQKLYKLFNHRLTEVRRESYELVATILLKLHQLLNFRSFTNIQPITSSSILEDYHQILQNYYNSQKQGIQQDKKSKKNSDIEQEQNTLLNPNPPDTTDTAIQQYLQNNNSSKYFEIPLSSAISPNNSAESTTVRVSFIENCVNDVFTLSIQALTVEEEPTNFESATKIACLSLPLLPILLQRRGLDRLRELGTSMEQTCTLVKSFSVISNNCGFSQSGDNTVTTVFVANITCSTNSIQQTPYSFAENYSSPYSNRLDATYLRLFKVASALAQILIFAFNNNNLVFRDFLEKDLKQAPQRLHRHVLLLVATLAETVANYFDVSALLQTTTSNNKSIKNKAKISNNNSNQPCISPQQISSSAQSKILVELLSQQFFLDNQRRRSNNSINNYVISTSNNNKEKSTQELTNQCQHIFSAGIDFVVRQLQVVSRSELEQFLSLDYNQLDSLDLSVIDDRIRSSLEHIAQNMKLSEIRENNQQLWNAMAGEKFIQAIQLFQQNSNVSSNTLNSSNNNSNQKQQQQVQQQQQQQAIITISRRQSYETVFTGLSELIKILQIQPNLSDLRDVAQNTLCLLENFVLQAEDLLSNLKVLSDFLLVALLANQKMEQSQQQQQQPQKPPEKLNLIIKPLVAKLSKEKYATISHFNALALCTLLELLKYQGAAPKILQNTLSGVSQQQQQQGGSNGQQNKQSDSHNQQQQSQQQSTKKVSKNNSSSKDKESSKEEQHQGEQENWQDQSQMILLSKKLMSELYAGKCAGPNELLSLVFARLGEKVFQTLPVLVDLLQVPFKRIASNQSINPNPNISNTNNSVQVSNNLSLNNFIQQFLQCQVQQQQQTQVKQGGQQQQQQTPDNVVLLTQLVQKLRLIRKLAPSLKDMSLHDYLRSIIQSLFALMEGLSSTALQQCQNQQQQQQSEAIGSQKKNAANSNQNNNNSKKKASGNDEFTDPSQTQNTVQKDLLQQQLQQLEKQVRKVIAILFAAFLRKEFRLISKFRGEYQSLLSEFLEMFYKSVKSRQVIAYQVLEDVLALHMEYFVDYASIFVLQIVKSLTAANQQIQEKAYRMLGSLITALFLQQQSSTILSKNDNDDDKAKGQNQANNIKVVQSSDSIQLSEMLQRKKQRGSKFILDFKNSSNFDYTVQFPVKADLRQYQQDGIKWLAFLVRYKLNGALCDDMGLGKTLQTLAVIQNEIGKDILKMGVQNKQKSNNTINNNKKDEKDNASLSLQEQKEVVGAMEVNEQEVEEQDELLPQKSKQKLPQQNKKNKNKQTQQSQQLILPSLIVTPPTLTEHWKSEILKFLDPEIVLAPIILQPLDLKDVMVDVNIQPQPQSQQFQQQMSGPKQKKRQSQQQQQQQTTSQNQAMDLELQSSSNNNNNTTNFSLSLDSDNNIIELFDDPNNNNLNDQSNNNNNNNPYLSSSPAFTPQQSSSTTLLEQAASQLSQQLQRKHRIWITSYNTLQKYVEVFARIRFKFVVLDEGHLIKNPKTKFALAVRRLQGAHKFILSGTPIQNNLQELWAIFDFLMPRYLGQEEAFRKHFSKLFATNILAFTDDALLFTDAQNRVLQDLHRRVMPFILRRDKQHVLRELPQKIIQDYFCTLSGLQLRLYEDLEAREIKFCEAKLGQEQFDQKNENEAKKGGNGMDVEEEDDQDNSFQKNKQSQHKPSQQLQKNQLPIKEEGEEACKTVLQTLITVRKLLNHPLMLLGNGGGSSSQLHQLQQQQQKQQGKKTANQPKGINSPSQSQEEKQWQNRIQQQYSSSSNNNSLQQQQQQPHASVYNQQLENLRSCDCSGKFVALRQLMSDLGFEDVLQLQQQQSQPFGKNDESNVGEYNTTGNTTTNTLSTNYLNKNKVLVFSRFKETLTLIAELLLAVHFPQVRFLRLAGDVPVAKRFQVVNKFNEDSEYQVLLLTTSVGGLGLNLSSANIVVMFDHDYNPMNDLQAIDRAHRIGQKNTLNVYRLITKDTLEEKIMGIQKFKINVANAIINLDNASIKNVQDSNIVSLFDSLLQKEGEEQDDQNKKNNIDANSKYMPYQKILAGMVEDMWEEQDYNKQY